MTTQQAGKIASRSIGILLFIIGMVILIEYLNALQQAKSLAEESGWSNLPSGSTEVGETEDAFSELHTHDTYYVTGSFGSFLSPYVLMVLGLIFLILSGPIGRLIAGKSEDGE